MAKNEPNFYLYSNEAGENEFIVISIWKSGFHKTVLYDPLPNPFEYIDRGHNLPTGPRIKIGKEEAIKIAHEFVDIRIEWDWNKFKKTDDSRHAIMLTETDEVLIRILPVYDFEPYHWRIDLLMENGRRYIMDHFEEFPDFKYDLEYIDDVRNRSKFMELRSNLHSKCDMFFSEIDSKFESELKEYEERISLQPPKQKRDPAAPTCKQQIIDLIKSKPGIGEYELYKELHDLGMARGTATGTVYRLDKDGIIRHEKTEIPNYSGKIVRGYRFYPVVI